MFLGLVDRHNQGKGDPNNRHLLDKRLMQLRLRQICLVAYDLQPVVADLKSVFGLEVGHVDPGVGVFGLENSILPVGNSFLEVVAPIQSNTAAERYLKRRKGNGGYMVITQCDDLKPRQKRVKALGIRLVHLMDYDGFEGMQLHPRDTGGAIFEIDWNEGFEQPDGPWWPAGKNWLPSKRTDVVSHFHAVELQSDDPSKLAQRWSDVAEIELQTNPNGQLTMPLENATLRFVETTDGRGEGLGGIDLQVVNKTHILQQAQQRGCPVEDDRVMVCGIRFGLI